MNMSSVALFLIQGLECRRPVGPPAIREAFLLLRNPIPKLLRQGPQNEVVIHIDLMEQL